MNKLIKRIFFVCLNCFLLLGNSCKIFADCAGGVESLSPDVIEEHYVSESEIINNNARSTLPSSVDLSDSIYFPPIATQGSIGNCGCFSMTYYQFTYEANKLNNVASNTTSTQYSPRFVSEATLSTHQDTVYEFLNQHGCVKWSEYRNDEEWSLSDPKFDVDPTAMRNALNTRLSEWYLTYLDTNEHPITSPNSSSIDAIKRLLATEEKVLYVTVNFGGIDWKTNEFGTFAVRSDKGMITHALVIVGYDDNVYYNVNGGDIEAAERGAFIVANSHGTGWHDGGFSYILYDALNAETQITGDWENKYSKERGQILSNEENGKNMFTWIDVANHNVMFVADLNLSMDERGHSSIELKRFSSTGTTLSKYTTFSFYYTHKYSFDGKLLFDYSPIVPSDTSILNGNYKLGITIADDLYDDNEISDISFSITDNLGNIISNSGQFFSSQSLNKSELTFLSYIKWEKGDLDYNNIINAPDALLVLKYASRINDLSNVQKNLADFNSDGVINAEDAQLILAFAAN